MILEMINLEYWLMNLHYRLMNLDTGKINLDSGTINVDLYWINLDYRKLNVFKFFIGHWLAIDFMFSFSLFSLDVSSKVVIRDINATTKKIYHNKVIQMVVTREIHIQIGIQKIIQNYWEQYWHGGTSTTVSADDCERSQVREGYHHLST